MRKLSYDEVTEVFTLQVSDEYGDDITSFTIPDYASSFNIYGFDCAALKQIVKQYRKRQVHASPLPKTEKAIEAIRRALYRRHQRNEDVGV